MSNKNTSHLFLSDEEGEKRNNELALKYSFALRVSKYIKLEFKPTVSKWGHVDGWECEYIIKPFATNYKPTGESFHSTMIYHALNELKKDIMKYLDKETEC